VSRSVVIDERPIEGIEDGVVVAPSGPLRARDGEAFRVHMDALLDRQPTALLLDLEGADSIDSAAVGYLLNIHDRLAAHGAAMALVAPSPPVRIVLDSIGLTEFFTVCESLDDAEALVAN
jgi:anti-anti-sigma factor